MADPFATPRQLSPSRSHRSLRSVPSNQTMTGHTNIFSDDNADTSSIRSFRPRDDDRRSLSDRERTMDNYMHSESEEVNDERRTLPPQRRSAAGLKEFNFQQRVPSTASRAKERPLTTRKSSQYLQRPDFVDDSASGSGSGSGSSSGLHRSLSGRSVRSNHSTATTSSSIARQPSVRSTFTPRSNSVYNGPTGPSHPYGMYPQFSASTLNRASTVTSRNGTTPYEGPGLPSHPYGMYPQILLPTIGDHSMPDDAADIANVGFPGLTSAFARDVTAGDGADDFIGQDGHVETLPPYSRFPERPAKDRYAASINEENQNQNHNEHSDQRSMTSTLRPLTATSGSTIPLLDVRASTAAQNVNSSTEHLMPRSPTEDDNLMDANGRRLPPTKETWSVKARKKTFLFGLPVWAITVLVAVAIVAAAVIGGVLGHFFAQKRIADAANKPHADSPPLPTFPLSTSSSATALAYSQNAGLTQTQQYVAPTAANTPAPLGASPTTVPPTNIPSLATGTFAIPLLEPRIQSNGCLPGQGQIAAWACDSTIMVGMNVSASDYDATQISLFTGNDGNSPLYYGSQIPIFHGSAPVELVVDIADSGKGPALAFQQFYDKLVIVQADAIAFNGVANSGSSPSSSSAGPSPTAKSPAKRQAAAVPQSATLVPPTDTPWFCYWNKTIIEGFIFVNQTSHVSSTLNASINGMLSTSWPGFTPQYYPMAVKLAERRNDTFSVPPFCVQKHNVNGQWVPLLNSSGNTIQLDLNEVNRGISRNRMFWGVNHQVRFEGSPFPEQALELDLFDMAAAAPPPPPAPPARRDDGGLLEERGRRETVVLEYDPATHETEILDVTVQRNSNQNCMCMWYTN